MYPYEKTTKFTKRVFYFPQIYPKHHKHFHIPTHIFPTTTYTYTMKGITLPCVMPFVTRTDEMAGGTSKRTIVLHSVATYISFNNFQPTPAMVQLRHI